MSKELIELQLQHADVLRKMAQLKDENDKHRARMSKLQYIEKEETSDDKRLWSKIVELGYVTKVQMDNVLRQKKKTIAGRDCPWYHPDHPKLKSMLAAISRRLRNAKFQNDHCYPTLRKGDRSNKYLAEDFRRFGDTVVSAYMVENPVSSWGIDWDWTDKHQGGFGYEDPFSPASYAAY